jgi:branched-chain amino acid transport system substrate-binding protein
MGLSRSVAVATSCLLALGVLAACSSSASKTASNAAAQSTPAGTVTSADLQTVLSYVGGKTGKADPSLAPVTIGFVNQQGGVVGYPEQESAADAAVSFINAHLDGVDGHPVKLDKCFIQAEEDAPTCASQFLQDKTLYIANMGVDIYGNATLYNLIGGKFPIIVTAAVTAADATTKDVYAMDGGSLANLNGIAENAQQRGYKKLAVISSNNPAAKYLLSSIVLPDLKKRGITTNTVYISDTATTPDYVTALQASGASSADAIELVPAAVGGCVSMYDAMKQVALVKPVITVTQCAGDPMPTVTGGGPEDWTITSLADLPLVPSPQSDAYNDIMAAYGESSQANVSFAPKGFGDMLTITKFAKAIGFANLSAAAFQTQITNFRGPAWMVPGPILCGGNPVQSGLCGGTSANSEYTNGKWIALPPYTDVTLARK